MPPKNTLKLTPKQQALRKSLLTKIHLADKYVNHFKKYEDDYRNMLEKNFGKRSAAHLTINQLITLLDFLSGKKANAVERVTKAQVDHIQASWKQKARDPSKQALVNFVSSNTGLTLISLHALTKKQASGIISALNRMQKRKG